jgi:hypothetical protein
MASVIIVIHVYDYAVSTRDKVGIGGLGGSPCFTMFHQLFCGGLKQHAEK